MSFDQIPPKKAGGPAWLSGGEAALTLHCPRHGAVEVRIRLDAGGVRAAVTTPPGPMSKRAAATLPDLVAGLERATGRPGIATVQARRGSRPGPTPPEGACDDDA
jgi:hypothetical protein